MRNYRNLVNQTVKLSDGLNIICGDNAQGKTNLIESVYLCCIGKSARTDKDKELIQWGQSVAHVKVRYSCRYGEGDISVGIASDRRKKALAVNSVALAKTGDLLGYLNCVYFSPAEIKIVSQSPAERRKFMDVDLCQTDKNYFYSLQRFNKALLQRNNLLKQVSDTQRIKDVIFVWDRQLAEEGARLIVKRTRFCQQLQQIARKLHEQLTDGKEQLDVQYCTKITGNNVNEIADNYQAMLTANLNKDIQMRFTTAGCQRDDIILSVNNVDLRNYGSQGQLRTAALSLKLAETEIIRQLTGEYPVLLLDDVLSELDEQRQQRLLTFSDKVQIILTTATPVAPHLLPQKYAQFDMTKGRLLVKQN